MLAALYVVSLLDRVNAELGVLSVNPDLGLTPTRCGIGAGLFFVGYLAFAVPANFLRRRFGAARWISTIADAGGCVSLCVALPNANAVQRRALLFWVAELGFLSGLILDLTARFPRALQGRIVANLFVHVPLSRLFGAPLPGVL